jgi:hypothetical protein
MERRPTRLSGNHVQNAAEVTWLTAETGNHEINNDVITQTDHTPRRVILKIFIRFSDPIRASIQPVENW